MATWNPIPQEWLLPRYKVELTILLNEAEICAGARTMELRLCTLRGHTTKKGPEARPHQLYFSDLLERKPESQPQASRILPDERLPILAVGDERSAAHQCLPVVRML